MILGILADAHWSHALMNVSSSLKAVASPTPTNAIVSKILPKDPLFVVLSLRLYKYVPSHEKTMENVILTVLGYLRQLLIGWSVLAWLYLFFMRFLMFD